MPLDETNGAPRGGIDGPELRARVLAEAMRIVVVSPAPVTLFAVQSQCWEAMKLTEEECAGDVYSALHLLCISELILSNSFERNFSRIESSSTITFAHDTEFVASKRLTSFIWREPT